MKIADPFTVQRGIHKYISACPDGFAMDDKKKGALTGHLNRALGNKDDDRHLVLGWVYAGTDQGISSTTLNDAEWFALNRWIAPSKVGDKWEARPAFVTEVNWILTLVIAMQNGAEIDLLQERVIIDADLQSMIKSAVQDLGGIPTGTFQKAVIEAYYEEQQFNKPVQLPAVSQVQRNGDAGDRRGNNGDSQRADSETESADTSKGSTNSTDDFFLQLSGG